MYRVRLGTGDLRPLAVCHAVKISLRAQQLAGGRAATVPKGLHSMREGCMRALPGGALGEGAARPGAGLVACDAELHVAHHQAAALQASQAGMLSSPVLAALGGQSGMTAVHKVAC